MKLVKVTEAKRSGKREKEMRVLIGLVEYYLKTGKAVGSNTLKEAGFPELSSATIRNYFATLEEDGYLMQHHTSGGRVPTEQAFRIYAKASLEEFEGGQVQESHPIFAPFDEGSDLKAISLFLQQMATICAEQAQCATFLTAPRFDQDFVADMKLVAIDQSRCLAVIITNFGQIYTELLSMTHKISAHSIKRIESYFQSRLRGVEMEGEPLAPEELELSIRFYQEAMARYLVSYANFSQEDIFCTGFSKLLRYPEFQEAQSLASSLKLFENTSALRSLARDSIRHGKMKCWIGEDLYAFLANSPNCTLISAPYHIAHKMVGCIGIIGPMRLPYKELFSLLDGVSKEISHYLEKNLYKYKISYRTPQTQSYELDVQSRKLLAGPKQPPLLKDNL